MKSFFVTGTDTGIGKTAFTCGLASLLRVSGIDVGVMKPFATGIPQKNGFQSEDVSMLVSSSGVSDPESLVNPYFFAIPASPYSAAKKLGKQIDLDLVLSSFDKLRSIHDVVLVEGIGGIMTPILKDYFVIDLIKDLNLDTIIVTGSKIGTINHTILTIDACKKHGIHIPGLIINQTDKNGYDLDELGQDLTSLSGVDVISKIPNLDNVGNITTILKNDGFLDVFSKL